MSFDPSAYLEKIGAMPDQDIDIGVSAIALAAVNHSGLSLDRYFHHLNLLGKEVGERHEELLNSGADDDVNTQLAALKHIIVDKHGYESSSDYSNNLESFSLIRVIENRKGSPVALCLLYIHVARQQGWDIAGLDVPSHFLCRLEKEGQRVIFDPSDGCRRLEAPDLRAIIKSSLGEHAELSSRYFEPVGNRRALITLQNKIKFRQIDFEDYSGAIATVQSMLKIDPDESLLLLDAGVLYAKTDQISSAIDSLEKYIDRSPDNHDIYDAISLLEELKEKL